MSDTKVKLTHFTETLKTLIENYSTTIKEEEFGAVITNSDGIVNISGIKNCQLNEVLLIDEKYKAIALSLKGNIVGAVIIDGADEVKDGMRVIKTNQTFSAPYGDSLLGRTIDVSGQPIDNLGILNETGWSPVEQDSPNVMDRQSVTEPLYTGIISIDSLIPIGKGQRELIIGDRQTGKTAIAIDAIINQKNKNCYCIYVSIGQKNSTLFQIIQHLREQDSLEYTTVVSASASDLPSLQFLAPFVGITVAEYWMKKGKDVLIVYDDLTQHAISYRTLSLLLEFPPGREAFPGDIFYLHSRLLERAGRLSEKLGGGSITAFPIIQTHADDIAAYIPSNVISIVDGQIFLKSLLFNSGQKPAVDVTLSVSRVGGAAQNTLIKNMSSTLKLELAQFFELQEFARFSSDLNESTKEKLSLGEKIQKIFVQKLNELYSPQEEALILFLIKNRYITKIQESKHIPLFLHDILGAWKKSKHYETLNLNKPLNEEMTIYFESLAQHHVDAFSNLSSK